MQEMMLTVPKWSMNSSKPVMSCGRIWKLQLRLFSTRMMGLRFSARSPTCWKDLKTWRGNGRRARTPGLVFCQRLLQRPQCRHHPQRPLGHKAVVHRSLFQQHHPCLAITSLTKRKTVHPVPSHPFQLRVGHKKLPLLRTSRPLTPHGVTGAMLRHPHGPQKPQAALAWHRSPARASTADGRRRAPQLGPAPRPRQLRQLRQL
mmetsp:Transcript_53706/g.87534  ORF Transcript_53706/g.87534 Transcript_53706/m.87534 type:complete len:203 (-) Transcript_53706:14-622(-)